MAPLYLHHILRANWGLRPIDTLLGGRMWLQWGPQYCSPAGTAQEKAVGGAPSGQCCSTSPTSRRGRFALLLRDRRTLWWYKRLDPHLCTSVNTSTHADMPVYAHMGSGRGDVEDSRLPVTSPLGSQLSASSRPTRAAPTPAAPRAEWRLRWPGPGTGSIQHPVNMSSGARGGEAGTGTSIKDHVLGLPWSSHQPVSLSL